MWLACRNVLDSAATPTLAGPVVVPSGPDLDNDHAASTAQALVSAHEVAEAYASTALRRSGTVGARQQAPRPGSVEKEPSVEFMTPAEVQTDIPELVLGGESCPKVPVRSLQAPKPTGTAGIPMCGRGLQRDTGGELRAASPWGLRTAIALPMQW